MTGVAREEERMGAKKELLVKKSSDIRWDVKGECCESQQISFETLNDYFVHTFALFVIANGVRHGGSFWSCWIDSQVGGRIVNHQAEAFDLQL